MAKRADTQGDRFSPVRSSLVRQAIETPTEPHDTPATPTPRVSTPATARQRPDREKRVRITRAEEADAHRFILRLADATGTAVQLSHVLRACLRRLIREQDRVLQRARERPPLTRPPNDNAEARARFEDDLVDLLAAAFTPR